MARSTPTDRAMKILEACGWQAGIVERRITYKLKHDLFGFADIIAVKPSDHLGTVAIQATAHGDVNRRVVKVLAEPRAIFCLQAGWRIEVWGMRTKPTLKDGSMLRAKTIIFEDMNLRVIEGSMIVDA